MFSPPFARPFAPPLGGLPASAPAGPVTVILDQFADNDATGIASHTIAPTNTPATSWTQRAGTWVITGNQACITAQVNRAYATCNSGVANCTVSASVKSTAILAANATDAGLIVRFVNTSNYWVVGINNTANAFRIMERNATVETERATVSVDIDAGTFYTISVVLSGTTITATLNGANEISYASATMGSTATVHGIRARETTDRVDDFKVMA